MGLLRSCIAHLGGLDVLVFTGGIGEHDPEARAELADALAWCGVSIEEGAGVVVGDDHELTAPGAAVRSFVVASREELQLATEAAALLGP